MPAAGVKITMLIDALVCLSKQIIQEQGIFGAVSLSVSLNLLLSHHVRNPTKRYLMIDIIETGVLCFGYTRSNTQSIDELTY